MQITIDVAESTVAQIQLIMRDANWEGSMSEFCLFLLRNAVSQVLTLKQMRDKYKEPSPPEQNP